MRPEAARRRGLDRFAVLTAPRSRHPRTRRWTTVTAAVMAALGTFLVVFPFDVTVDGVTARCGPPAFEVLVPSDAAFDVPENTLCGPPALHRLIVGSLALAVFFGIAFANQWSARSGRHRRRGRREPSGDEPSDVEPSDVEQSVDHDHDDVDARANAALDDALWLDDVVPRSPSR